MWVLGALAMVAAPLAAPHEGSGCESSRPHPIDIALDAAIADSGGVTAAMRDAQAAAFDAWDALLEREYQAMLALTAGSRRERLHTAQRAWLAYDEAQARWDRAMHAEEGTSAALDVAGAAVARRRARTCEREIDLNSLRGE